MTDVINTKQLEDIFSAVEGNTKDLVVASAANKRASASLEVMQVRGEGRGGAAPPARAPP